MQMIDVYPIVDFFCQWTKRYFINVSYSKFVTLYDFDQQWYSFRTFFFFLSVYESLHNRYSYKYPNQIKPRYKNTIEKIRMIFEFIELGVVLSFVVTNTTKKYNKYLLFYQ